MKEKLRLLLVALGVILILGIASYFPYGVLYYVPLTYLGAWGQFGYYLDPNLFRLKITIFAFIVAALIILHMLPLRKVCRALGLVIFQRLLSVGIFYVVIMTILMVAGMWFDFNRGMGSPMYELPRMGFLFVPSKIGGVFH